MYKNLPHNTISVFFIFSRKTGNANDTIKLLSVDPSIPVTKQLAISIQSHIPAPIITTPTRGGLTLSSRILHRWRHFHSFPVSRVQRGKYYTCTDVVISFFKAFCYINTFLVELKNDSEVVWLSSLRFLMSQTSQVISKRLLSF